ncbi:MAG: hypothetical protein RR397_07095 [Odoribacter sp.]
MVDPIYGSVFPHNSVDDPLVRKKLAVDFSVGIMGFFNQYHLGIATQHLAQPSLAFSDDARLSMKYTVGMIVICFVLPILLTGRCLN